MPSNIYSMANHVPFSIDFQLDRTLDHWKDEGCVPIGTLPGQPRISFDDPDRLTQFLLEDLSIPLLEKMAPWLWMLSTQSSDNISPLQHQRVKGREIVITENPQLHLVWFYNRIYLKPIP